MRMLIYLWIGLTCVLGIYGDDMVRRAAEGSGGAQMQGSGLPIAPDDEDYSSSYFEPSDTSSFSDSTDYGSGGGDYSQSESAYSETSDMTPSEETNVIKVHGEFKIDGIGGGKLEWMEDLADKTSNTFTEFSNLIKPVIQRALEAKKSTRKGLQSVNILGFRHGSIIVEYEAVYGPDSKVTGDQFSRSMKDAFSAPDFGRLEVNPESISPVDVIQPQPQGVVVTDQPPATTPKRPVATDPPMVPTTKASNSIDKDPVKPPKPDNNKPDNEVGGGVIDIDNTPEPNTEDNNEIPNDVGNTDGREGGNTKEEANVGFWDKLFSHPLILAGLVGGVVIALLTVVLLLMFVVYRLKKKDEGSYSLDEPHKVKDPMAYWKDTKEFYA